MSFDVDTVLSQLTVKEKVALLSGVDYWHTYPVPHLGVPSIRTSDGPNGVRGQFHFNSTPTSAIPVGTALASSWNKDLLFEAGELLELELRAKGSHVLLAPTINIQRIPNGGRGFESYSEDPVLSGELAAEYVKGVQSKGLAAVIKHYVGNDQENERFSSNSIISQKALREIYLKPFEIALKKAKPKGLMTSYNRVNGIHASESKFLLQEVLRKEWGWEGAVMSDWTGTYSTSEAIKAGLDIEMPGPGKFRGASLIHSLLAKTVSEEDLNFCVKNVLTLIKSVEGAGVGENEPEKEINTPELRFQLRKLAQEAIVLLKNDDDVLPFQKTKTLVIGPNATYAAYSGGGSALVTPSYSVSPLDGIKEKIGKEYVSYTLGAYNHRYLPSLKDQLFNGSKNGTLIEIFNEKPTSDSKPFDVIDYRDINYFRMNDYVHPELKSPIFYATLRSKFIPNESGDYIFGIAVYGTAKLFIDGELIIDNATHQKLGESFYGAGTDEVTGIKTVEAGKGYDLRIEFGSGATSEWSKNTAFFGGGGLRFGGVKIVKDEDAISEAVEKAKSFKQVVIVTGLNQDYESEGAERQDLRLPGYNDELISRVLEANPNTVVVLQSGTPLEAPWIHNAKAVIWQSYSGNETGNALADVLYGDVNPSGKLPLTFPVRFGDTPSYLNNTTSDGRVLYGEDIFVGYRYYEKVQRAVLFPFGHGLSYSKFELSDFQVEQTDSELNATVKVSNSGKVDGAAVVQVYVGSTKKFRPKKELKAFEKVVLKAGESKAITLALEINEATKIFSEEKDAWLVEAGDYELIVSQSSCDDGALGLGFTVKSTQVIAL